MTPLLLISVRNAVEAALAAENGADIIDVKDPARGPLGRADNETVSSVVEVVTSFRGRASLPITMALGELRDLRRDQFVIPSGVQMLKLGLAGCDANSTWRSDWADLKSRSDAGSTSAPDWVAVVYADRTLAESPSAIDIIHAGSELGCCGVLIDTFCKSAGRLWDFVDLNELHKWSNIIHRAGMFTAVAGSLRVADLSRIAEFPGDVLAVRGGVCAEGDRDSTIAPDRVREFRRAMETSWPASDLIQNRQRHSVDRKLAQHRLALSNRGRG